MKRLHTDTIRALKNRTTLSAGDEIMVMLATEVLERRVKEGSMSLYSDGEICSGCPHAVFHEDCCMHFCRCKENAEDERNYLNGTCAYRKAHVQEGNDE